ncbi:hypothetical protein C2W64_00621 [Brevibacillus laterosporus]|nr:hypothetical protein C2W64_00621 [Brevibacillus laterosporus]
MNMYHWADYYDLTQRGLAGDLAFYEEYAKAAKGEVLELGCGTGRVTIPLAKAGIQITGLEISQEMLAKAVTKAEGTGPVDHLSFIQGDMRHFSLGKTFELIMIPYRSFLHLLHIQEQMKALRCIREHLQPGGKLVFNVFVPHIKHLYEEGEKLTLRGIYPFQDGQQVAMYDFTRYDHFQQLAEVTRSYELLDNNGKMLERVTGLFTLRYIFPAELHHLLRLAGFKVLERYGSFAKTPFDSASTEFIIVASPA